MSATVQQLEVATTTVERRFYPRIVPHAPIFIAIGESKECLLINVGENGLLVSTPAELSCNYVARISLPLNGLPNPVQVNVRVVWVSEARKLAGVQWLDLSEHDREQIRKWGAQESRRSLQADANQPLAVATSTTLLETTNATPLLSEQILFRTLQGIAPANVHRIVRTRSGSAVAGIAMWGVLAATVSVGAAFIFRNGGPGSSFARSMENRHESSAGAPQTQDIREGVQNPDASNRGAGNQAASPAPSVDASKLEGARSATPALQNSAQRGETSPDDGAKGYALGAAQNQPDGSRLNSPSPAEPKPETDSTSGTSTRIAESQAGARNDLAPTGETAAVADAAAKSSSPAAGSSASSDQTSEMLPAVPVPPPAKEPVRNPMRANDVAGDSSTTIASSPIVPLVTPAPGRKPDAGVIQMDAPGRQVLEIHLPRGYQASFYNLPGERVVESTSVTMHIQRSVQMPTTHVGWASHRNKKVIVGGLISRVDPQAAQVRIRPGDSVLVKATVGKEGSVESVTPIRGPSNLALTVVKAVRQWRYQPTFIDNKPVETQSYVVVQFHAPARRAVGQ
jgi:hypothetical protein